VVAWIRFVRHAPLPRSAALGVAIALAGLACVVEVWSGLSLDLLGVLAGLGAAACQATFFLIVDRMSDKIDPLVMTAAGTTVATAALLAVASPWTMPWHVLASGVRFGDGTRPGWFIVVWLILVSTVIAYVTSVAAVHRLSAPVAGAVGYIEAVSAALVAWIVLGEHLSAVQLTGGAIVLTGAFVAQRSVVPAEVTVGETPLLEHAGGVPR
jgi:drug/metabolite transporter (DMT)-like permease